MSNNFLKTCSTKWLICRLMVNLETKANVNKIDFFAGKP